MFYSTRLINLICRIRIGIIVGVIGIRGAVIGLIEVLVVVLVSFKILQEEIKYEIYKELSNLRHVLCYYNIKSSKSKHLPRIKMQGIDDDSANSRVRSNHLFVRLGNLYPLQSSR